MPVERGTAPTPRRRGRGIQLRRWLFRTLESVLVVLSGVVGGLAGHVGGAPPAVGAPETADWAPFRGAVELWCTKTNPSQWGTCSSHHSYDAIDIGMPRGTPIYAAGPGTVIDFNNTCVEGDSSCSGGRGRFVTIRHPDGRRSRYLHLSAVNVTLNQSVARGQQIGLSGNTGNTTAPHLHYDEQDSSGTNIDPGPMKALHGSTVVEYPTVAGYSSWWVTPYGTPLRNDGFLRPSGSGDFTGDGRADLSVYDLGTGTWKIQGEPDSTLGGPGHAPVPADYDGDGRTDRAVYDLTNGIWKTAGQADVVAGGSGLVPVPGDYDGDGRWERAVYDLTSGVWKIPGQADVMFGAAGSWPVPGDYDGDGDTDIAVYDAKAGLWKVRGQPDVSFGGPGQIPVPGDYNSLDGWEMATYSPADGVWRIEGQATITLGGPGQVPAASDRDGDGRLEPAVYQPATGIWKITGQPDVSFGGPRQVPVSSPWPWSVWAVATANSVNADLLGDVTSEPVAFRPAAGQWLTPGQPGIGFGQAGDIPLLGDLDGDGRADRTVYRPSLGVWFTQAPGWLPFQVTTPQPGDVPLLADVTGDRRAEPMVYRPASGQLFTLNAGTAVLGSPGDVPVVGDLDGDQRAEVGVFRGSTGQWLFPGRAPATFGQAGDVPVLADVDGDRRADLAVFRPSSGIWFVAVDGWWPFTYGQPGDVPMVADFAGEGRSAFGVFRPASGEFLRIGQPALALGQPGDIPTPLGVGVGPQLAGAPATPTAQAGNQSATVSWQPSASNGGTTIIGYTITSSPGNVTTTVGPTAQQATITGLSNGVSYTFTVRAVNVVGTGPASAPSNPVIPVSSSSVPGPPTSVSAYAGFQQATVSWSAPTQTGGSAVTSYTVVASPGGVSATVPASQTTATITGLTNGTTYTFTVTATNANGPGVVSAPSNPVTPPGIGGGFHPLRPERILDTRTGLGGPAIKLGPGEERVITVTGVGGVPATNVTAVVMNVTVTGPTAASHLTVWPADQTRPDASNLNFVAGQTVPNLAVARVSADGKVKVFNNAGSTDVIFDVVGWYDSGGGGGDRYTALAPDRILDTRDGTGGAGGMLGPSEEREVAVTGVGEVPAANVTAVVMNVTVTGPTAASHLTVWPADQTRPNASNLNFVAGQTAPNLVIARVSADGKVKVFNNAGSTHVIFDVVGYYSIGGTNFTGLAPRRIFDSRIGLGGPIAKLGPGQQRQVSVVGTGGVPPSGVTAVVINVTATGPTTPSHLTIWPFGQAMPTASSLNVAVAETRANLVVARVGSDGTVWVFNNSGYLDVVIDVVGYYS